jgi:hypothetical protein
MSDVSKIKEVVFKAELFNGDILLSTGWAFEREGDGMVNQTSHLENCETSAIGRALANITIHGDKRPSREEMEKVQRGPQPTTQPTKTDTAINVLLGVVADVKEKKFGDKPFWVVTLSNGESAATFDAEIGKSMSGIVGKLVEIPFSFTKKGNKNFFDFSLKSDKAVEDDSWNFPSEPQA